MTVYAIILTFILGGVVGVSGVLYYFIKSAEKAEDVKRHPSSQDRGQQAFDSIVTPLFNEQ